MLLGSQPLLCNTFKFIWMASEVVPDWSEKLDQEHLMMKVCYEFHIFLPVSLQITDKSTFNWPLFWQPMLNGHFPRRQDSSRSDPSLDACNIRPLQKPWGSRWVTWPAPDELRKEGSLRMHNWKWIMLKVQILDIFMTSMMSVGLGGSMPPPYLLPCNV